ncbi:MAG TPA: zinc ribbon domain-containing protein [Desulfobacteraceae bacterium]|nr:zinc ribbon domain-containing protein [Desulfobacteraceae bacterium]
MPIYEYECTKCGHQTEAWQKFSDPPIIECELCHSKMKKLISQSTFHLKGTGWYVTDYASKSGGKQAQSQNQGGPKSDSESKISKETSNKKEPSSKNSESKSSKKTSKKPETKES